MICTKVYSFPTPTLHLSLLSKPVSVLPFLNKRKSQKCPLYRLSLRQHSLNVPTIFLHTRVGLLGFALPTSSLCVKTVLK